MANRQLYLDMIPIGRINNPNAAQIFCDYLQSKKIVADWLPDGAMYLIRVQGVQRVEEARAALHDFLRDPRDSRYSRASWTHGESAANSGQPFSSTVLWPQPWSRTGPVSFALVSLSVAISLLSGFGDNENFVFHLWFHLPSILSGELHRLITPIFLHLSFIHLLFNMMWLWDLGGVLEKRLGPSALVLLVLLVGTVSNLTQYLVSGPFFGGMYAVVYGLLGYLWTRGRRDPRFGVRLNPGVIGFMLLWLVLCFTGLLGPVANAAHVSGLVMGIALGVVASFKGNKLDG